MKSLSTFLPLCFITVVHLLSTKKVLFFSFFFFMERKMNVTLAKQIAVGEP